MTKDEEIEMLNRRINGWQQSYVDVCKSSSRKCRKLRKEIRSLHGQVEFLKGVSDGKGMTIDRLIRDLETHTVQAEKIKVLLLNSSQLDNTESLYANVAAALARASLGKK